MFQGLNETKIQHVVFLTALRLVHPWWSHVKNEFGLFCQMQGFLWDSMFNPLCQVIYLFSAKYICEYFSVRWFF